MLACAVAGGRDDGFEHGDGDDERQQHAAEENDRSHDEINLSPGARLAVRIGMSCLTGRAERVVDARPLGSERGGDRQAQAGSKEDDQRRQAEDEDGH